MSEHKDYGGECYTCGGDWPCDYDRGYRDALRQAADSLDNLRDSNEYDDPYVRGITRAFHRGIDRSQERLRARAEAVTDDD